MYLLKILLDRSNINLKKHVFYKFLIASITALSLVAEYVYIAMFGEKISKKKVEHDLLLGGGLIKSCLLCDIVVLVKTT